MKAHSYLEHTFKVQVPEFSREIVSSAFKESVEAGVPGHAKVKFAENDFTTVRYVLFTWTDEYTWEETGQ